jgi:protein SCO1/2/putative membrane protein
MKSKLVWLLFVAVAACAVAAAVSIWNRRAGSSRVPDFRLVDRTGKTVTRRDLLGEVWIAEFIFTRCQASCPRMYSAMDELRRRLPGIRFVSFTVDPEHDTPQHLADWAPTMGLAHENWYWLSGVSRDEMQRIAHGFNRPGSSTGEEIVHSERFFLVDRYGRFRESYPVINSLTLARDEAVLQAVAADVYRLLGAPYLPVTKLPAANAALNGTSFVLLLLGIRFIKAKMVGAHKAAMLSALGVSGLFLVSYLTAHYFLGSTPYGGEGWRRPVYFTILISHTVLAALVAVLAPLTVYYAFRDQIDRHKGLAKVTFPIWLYVSLTGVVIYFMLYGGPY